MPDRLSADHIGGPLCGECRELSPKAISTMMRDGHYRKLVAVKPCQSDTPTIHRYSLWSFVAPFGVASWLEWHYEGVVS